MEKSDKNSHEICNGSSSKTVAKWGIVNENLSLLKTFRLKKLNSSFDPHPKKSAIITILLVHGKFNFFIISIPQILTPVEVISQEKDKKTRKLRLQKYFLSWKVISIFISLFLVVLFSGLFAFGFFLGCCMFGTFWLLINQQIDVHLLPRRRKNSSCFLCSSLNNVRWFHRVVN